MKRILTPIFVLWTCILIAQPTVTTDWLPGIGDQLSSVSVTIEEPISAGPSGGDVLYDFSGVPLPDTLERVTFSVVDPATTPFADFFQDADIALGYPEFGLYSYAKITDGCLEDLGNTLSGLAFQIYTDPRSFACAPLTYEDTFSDEYEGTYEFLGVVTHSTGSVVAIVDGWGTLLMPDDGTEIKNVLRLRSEEINIDSTDLGSGIREKVISESTVYNFLSADYKNVLLSVTESYETQIGMSDGIPNDTIKSGPFYDFSYDPEPQEIGTARTPVLPADRIGMRVFPNPAGENINIQFESAVHEPVQIRISDLTGSQVGFFEESVVPGQNAIPVAVDRLEPGMYIVTLQGAAFSSSMKFMRR